MRTYTNNEIEKLQRYDIDEETDCWTWNGAVTARGYGNLRFMGKVMLVHRVIAELYLQPLGKGDVVHHKCWNQLCMNPAHLQVVNNRAHTSYHILVHHGLRERDE